MNCICLRVGLLGLLLLGPLRAEEVHVMISGGLTAAYNALTPEFEKATGHKLITS